MLFRDFLIFAAYYLILKAVLLVLNLETRRNKVHVPAAIAGLLS